MLLQINNFIESGNHRAAARTVDPRYMYNEWDAWM